MILLDHESGFDQVSRLFIIYLHLRAAYNEAWNRFDILKIDISCGTYLRKLFRSEYFKVI